MVILIRGFLVCNHRTPVLADNQTQWIVTDEPHSEFGLMIVPLWCYFSEQVW